ncbi:hypothetical protein [Carboxylicivirga sp. RSCT41]|uniref:hypothetical protein n=1 Tax=Carboxylicivirga agarovorans TaxID=3417570 RepID=UPI003D33F85A
MDRRKTFNLTILCAIALFISFAACDDNNNYFNVQEAIEAEQELLDRYYNEEMDNGMSRLDSTTAVVLDTIDNRFQSGLMLYHTHIGEGDSIGAYRTVGFRYKRYQIAIDTTDNADKTVEVLMESNEFSISPFTFTTYPVGGSPVAGTSVFPGINEAILEMRLFGKAKVVLPSSIADGQYSPHIFELEVTTVRR